MSAEPQESHEDRLHHRLALLEAALYVAGKPLDLNEICAVLGSRSKKNAQKLTNDAQAGLRFT